MEYIIVGVVLGIILLSGLIGRHKGLVKMVLSMMATLIAILVASVLTRPVCNVIMDELGLIDEMKQVVEEAFGDVEIKDISYVNDLELPDAIKEKIIEGVEDIDISIKDYVIESIASVALSAIVFLIIFVISIIALSIIIGMTDLVVKLPLIAQANRAAGMVAGLIYGIVLVWIAMILLTAMSGTSWSSDILATIHNNPILSLIYDSNPIMGALAKIIESV